MLEFLYDLFIESGNAVVSTWLMVFVISAILFSLSRIFTHFRQIKIQNRKYKWALLRHELMWSALNMGITALVLKHFAAYLVDKGYLTTDPSPVSWYVIVFEFALYFVIFDLYFYIVHRTFHREPLYQWVHKIHHRSLSPNPLSSSSMTPIEGIAEGLIVPLFLAAFTIHEASSVFIIPFATLMGLYVHCGYEFVPRWWYRNPLTSWFITPMFHDQHHQFVTCNYGGYTTIWDRVFGTVRPRFFEDFDRLKQRARIKQEKILKMGSE